MARRHPGLRSDLDDIVQESYWRLLRARSSGTIRNVRTYLFGIAQNVANQIHRSHRRNPHLPINEIPPAATISEEGDIVQLITHQQDVALAADAIKALPDRCREIVTLYTVEGLSYREIAQRLNLAEETVRVQMARAIKKCVAHLRASNDPLT
jgi:RNA polymerase sigma factor (sigma-70 family)